MAINGSDNVQTFLRELDNLNVLVESAPKNLLSSKKCVLSRDDVFKLVDSIRNQLPQAVTAAGALLDEEATIREEAEKSAAETVKHAEDQAENILAEAKAQLMSLQQQIEAARTEAETIHKQSIAQAQQINMQAQQEAEAIRQNATTQANQIVMEAQAKADQLVAAETIYKHAEIKADEMLQNAQQETQTLRANTFQYLDDILGQAEKYLTGLVDDVHHEHDNVRSAR